MPLKSFMASFLNLLSLLKTLPQMTHRRLFFLQKAVLVVSCLGPRIDDSIVFIRENWSMSCKSTTECWETAMGLVTNSSFVMSDCMLISILSMPVEPVLRQWMHWLLRLETSGMQIYRVPESDVCLQEVKFILNPVLPLCHFLRSLARLGLGKFSIANPLGFEPSL